MWKIIGLFLRKNYLLRCSGWLSLLNWIRTLTLSLLLKLPSRKLDTWFVVWIFFLLKLLCISVNPSYDHEYSYYIWTGAPICYLELLDKLQKGIYRTVGPSLAASLEHLAHGQIVARLNLVYMCYFGRCSSELARLVLLPYSWGRSTRYSDRLHDFSVTIPIYYKDVYVNSVFPCTAKLKSNLL